MTIFLLPTSYPNEDNPTANTFIRDQVKALSKVENNKIIVLNVQKQPLRNIFYDIDTCIHMHNDTISTIIYKKQKTFFEHQLILLNQILFNRSMKSLYKYAINTYGKPDVIYAHFYSAAFAAIQMTSDNKIPIIVLEHSGLLMNNHINKRNKYILRKVLYNVDTYMATTDNLKQHVIAHTGIQRQINVLPNIIDDIFQYHPKVNKAFSFFSLARFEFDKRIDLLVEAFCDAFSPNDNVTIYIGGNGKEYENIFRLVTKKKRTGQIILLGQLERQQILEEMIKCSCFVLPSRHETFGLVWREALCVGRPVITTNHGGFGKTDWKDSYGIMVPVDDKKSLSYAMTSIVRDYSKYDLQKISYENIEMYSSSNIIKEIMVIMHEDIEKQVDKCSIEE